MSFAKALFVKKKTVESKESGKMRSLIVNQDSVKIKDLHEQLNVEKHKSWVIEEKISRAEMSLAGKMEEYEKELKGLREQITHYRQHSTPTNETINKHIDEAEKLHQKLIFAINDFKYQIDKQLIDQERDTIKMFDMKLLRICNEIEERKKKGS